MKREMSNLVCRALSGYVPVLSLRGVDDLAREGGDLDFMVSPGLAIAACKLVAKAAIDSGWYIGCFRDIDYLAQIILIRPAIDGKDEAIKIDFFDGLRWYGVGNDSAAVRLFNIHAQTDINESRLAGAAGFFQKLLIVGQLSERDWARVSATGADEVYLAETAESIYLNLSSEQVKAHAVFGLEKWRLRACSGGVKSFLSALIWFCRVSLAHFKFKMGYGTKAGCVMSISGMDGSGKSSLVDRLLAAYLKAGGKPPMLSHLLPPWLPLPHQIFRRKKTSNNYARPYSEPPVTSKVSGFLRLAYYLVAFAITRVWLSIEMFRGEQVILDRSFVDFVSDFTRARIQQVELPAKLLRLLIPAGQLFYLDASPDAVVARKGELSFEKASALQQSYLAICEVAGITILNANNAPNVVFAELLSHISREYMRRIENAEMHQRAS